MDISKDLLCLFTAQIESRNGEVVITIPERELAIGDLEENEHYRVAVLSTATESDSTPTTEVSGREQEPPVSENDQLQVEIEDVGDQGDGIARVGPGYIVFVPGTGIGDRITVEITEARENFAFAEVIQEEPIS